MEEKNKKDLTLVLKNTGWVGGGQLSNVLLRYIYTVTATRLLGPVDYGLFVIGRSVMQLSTVLSEFGVGVAVQRQVAFYSGKNNQGKISQSIRFGFLLVLLNSIILTLLIFFSSNFLAAKVFKNSELAFVLKLFSFAIPIVTMLRVFYNIFQGYKRIKYRIFLEYAALHVVNIILLVVLLALGFKISGIIGAFIAANLLALLGAFYLYTRIPTFIKKQPNRVKIERETRKEVISYAAPLVFTSTLNFLQRWADTFLLAILSTSLSVGIYNVSLRLSEFVSMPLIAFNMIFAPMIAEIYAQNDIGRLKFNYQVVTKLIFTFSLLIYSIILLFPAELLSIFGNEFKNASTALVVLCIGRLINASVGATGWMLVMTGHPRIEMYNSLFFVGLTVVLNLILIPRFNVLGAGIANAVTLSIINIARVFQIYQVIRIHPFRWDYLKPVAAIVVSVTIVYYLKKSFSINLLTFVLLVFILTVMYVLINIVLGIKSEERWILSQIKQKIVGSTIRKDLIQEK